MEYVTKTMIQKISDGWKLEANRSLTKSKDDYIRSLIVVDKGRFEGLIILQGALPNMIESGVGAFDMKIGFEKSEKKHLKEDGGWYMNIPFRFATPGSEGTSSIFSGILPNEVYSAVKKEGTLKQSTVPSPFNATSKRPEVATESNLFKEYKHKNSIYAGLSRNSKEYSKATQSQYNTFRRVSDKSDAEAFIHSGIIAHNLAEKTIERINIPLQVDMLVDNFLNDLFN